MFTVIVIIALLIVYIIVMHLRYNKVNRHVRRAKDEEARLAHFEKMASLGTLSAGVAHEINNPLTFLITNIDLLARYISELNAQSSRKDVMKEILEECSDGVDRIKRIVRDLLAFAHPSTGAKSQVDVSQLLDVTVRILWSEIKYKADIERDYRATSKILVDPTQLNQVFLNLVINAAQAMKGKGVISISTYEEAGNIIVKIADTGSGIAKKDMVKIFEPFYTSKGGTGLGLYVSKNILAGYGGNLDVQSVEGKGTTFTITLPRQKAPG